MTPDQDRIREEIAGAVVSVPPPPPPESPAVTSDRVVLSMSRRTLRRTLVLVSVFLVGALAYAYANPYLTVSRVRRAAVAGDAETVNAHVDFPALRESLRGWMGAAIAKRMSESDMRGNPFAGLGAALGALMVDKMVDMMVTPESVRMMVEGHRPKPGATSEPEPTPPPNLEMQMGYEALDRFVVTVRDPRQSEREFTMVWRRSGLTWKLSSLRLPAPE